MSIHRDFIRFRLITVGFSVIKVLKLDFKTSHLYRTGQTD